jgi:hypothetical protein
VISQALDVFRAKPDALADALNTYLGPAGVQTLLELLNDRAATHTS